MTTSQRSNWGSKVGFILAATGSAVGLGAIWKFPYMAGANGGSAFIIPFLLMVLFFGVVLILAEMIIGRAGRGSVVTGFRRMAGPVWVPLGFLSVFCAYLIMTYYATVGGWCLIYLVQSFMGQATSPDMSVLSKLFEANVSSPVRSIIYQTIFLGITAGVILFGVNKGIERISKVLMPALFFLMCILIVRGLTLPGAWEGLKYMFFPRWEEFTTASLLNAMGFTFFSLSVGMGIMITYGSYIHKDVNVPNSAAWVAVLAVIASILAGIMIIPPVVSFGLDLNAGPGLTFITIPAVFSHMPFGSLFAICFYVCLLVAALTSMISLFEVPLSYLMDEWHMTRRGATILLFISLSICAIPAALSMGPWADVKFFGKTYFDLADFVACNILMPINAIFVVALAGWFYWDKTSYELTLNHPRSPLWLKWLRFVLAFICPCFIVLVVLSNFI